MKFTLRDLFWLTLVVALAVGWLADSANLRTEMHSRAMDNQLTVTKLQAVISDLQQVVAAQRALEKSSAWRPKD